MKSNKKHLKLDEKVILELDICKKEYINGYTYRISEVDKTELFNCKIIDKSIRYDGAILLLVDADDANKKLHANPFWAEEIEIMKRIKQ